MATAIPPKPWKSEYAKSGRSSCKTCKSPIAQDSLRLGKMIQARQFDGFMPTWNHARCVYKKGNQIKALDDVEGIDLLRWEDQQEIRKYVEGGVSKSDKDEKVAIADKDCSIEESTTSRATCKQCNEKIIKGTVRVSSKTEGARFKGLAWHHVNCFLAMSPSTNLQDVSGWDSLSPEDKELVSSLVKKGVSSTKEDCKGEPSDQVTSKGTKRRKVGTDEQKSKVLKSEGNTSADGVRSKGNATKSSNADPSLESALEKQSKELWNIKDELKKHVTNGELREMLEANGQDSAGSEYNLRERCADGMLFGALGCCPLCSAGSLCYSGGRYSCNGYLSAWSKCSYSTTEPSRLKEKWKIPDGTSNEYLLKWFKSQKTKKSPRVLPPPTKSSSVQTSPMQFQQSNDDRLDGLRVALAGKFEGSMDEWKKALEEAGGQVHAKIKKDTSCLVVGEDRDEAEIKKARRMKIPVVREDYLAECIRKQKKLPFDAYKVETASETSKSGMVTVKVKGRSAVHESSGMQDSGHILEVGKSIYNTTLNMSDLSTGINSYYILQIIEEDKGSDCYVFRKWGRVGNDKIGGTKLDGMSKTEAIQDFKRLFLEKTGNSWEAWEQKQDFNKQPGRFFPLDIDYGVKNVPKRDVTSSKNSQLAPQLIKLMEMLFNVETYRAALLEFEINMTQMPLGKLSKENIQKGFQALTEIQNLLSDSNVHDPSMKESLLVDSSNRFFTLIPSIHPHVIRDETDFKAKVKMLEALQDIEIASKLVGFDNDDDSLDEKYQRLGCDISPLPHDSSDYKLIEHYLLNTHAPTHTDWSLELEEVFALDRKGEFDMYAPYRQKLQNKMLLWHGSRLTNFVGILNQGLRIAPPEAPATGYMFGKGIYFADLVSKSAQYCYVDKKEPVGLLLLSEVALGEMHELKKALYMEKPPRGKHSTKGLGKTAPLEAEFVKWKDDVVVPCGKPVPSSVRSTELLYNEYIVYQKAQVKMQFLLKVRFHHKR